MIERTGKGTFRAFFPQDVVLFIGQHFLPLLIASGNFCNGRSGGFRACKA